LLQESSTFKIGTTEHEKKTLCSLVPSRLPQGRPGQNPSRRHPLAPPSLLSPPPSASAAVPPGKARAVPAAAGFSLPGVASSRRSSGLRRCYLVRQRGRPSAARRWRRRSLSSGDAAVVLPYDGARFRPGSAWVERGGGVAACGGQQQRHGSGQSWCKWATRTGRRTAATAALAHSVAAGLTRLDLGLI
jgi:hypothetical protein